MRHFGFLDWSAIYGLVDVGYRYTQERLLGVARTKPAFAAA